MKRNDSAFNSLCTTISKLRKRNGCPWDQKQTCASLKKYIQEECEELIEAIDENTPPHLCEELGDVLFLLILVAEINEESAHFTIEDVISGINDKMIRRHPHVFANAPLGSEKELQKQWEKIKSQEKEKK